MTRSTLISALLLLLCSPSLARQKIKRGKSTVSIQFIQLRSLPSNPAAAPLHCSLHWTMATQTASIIYYYPASSLTAAALFVSLLLHELDGLSYR